MKVKFYYCNQFKSIKAISLLPSIDILLPFHKGTDIFISFLFWEVTVVLR